MKRPTTWTFLAGAGLLAWASAGQSAPAQAPGPADPMSAPSQYGIRFTPEMARGLAREFVHDNVIRRYEVDKAREAEMTEMVARRMMEAIHGVDSAENQVVVERLAATFLKYIEEAERKHHRAMPPELGEALAKDLLPLVPRARELVRNLGQDIRPMLSMKQQLRMAADLMAVKTVLDGFETTMQRWSTGDVRPDDDPFDDDAYEHNFDEERGPDGKSQRYHQARAVAQSDRLLKVPSDMWEQYIKQAKAFYGFDESQSATADSILREIRSRGQQIAQDNEWKDRRAEVLFWQQLTRRLGGEFRGDDHPLTFVLNREEQATLDPVAALTRELRERVDRLPREEQRRAAEAKVAAKLADLGFEEPTTQPDAQAKRDN